MTTAEETVSKLTASVAALDRYFPLSIERIVCFDLAGTTAHCWGGEWTMLGKFTAIHPLRITSVTFSASEQDPMFLSPYTQTHILHIRSLNADASITDLGSLVLDRASLGPGKPVEVPLANDLVSQGSELEVSLEIAGACIEDPSVTIQFLYQ